MSRPNFIFIVSDSLRADYLSYAGHPDVSTPFLQEASRQGCVFHNHYAQAPVCGPSRNSFWTGRYPHSNGSFCNLASFGSHQRTFVEILGQAGYDCVSFGQNHLQPEPAGFSKIVSSRYQHPGTSYRKYLAGLNLERDPGEIDPISQSRSSLKFGLTAGAMEYLPDAYSVTRAIEYLEGQTGSPFFLYLGLHLPHPPYACDREHFDMYDPSKISIVDSQDPGMRLHPKLQERYDAAGLGALTEEDVRKITALYLGMITFVDEQVGRVMQVLRETGLDSNTHLVFTSDHADFCGEMGMYVKTDLPIRPLTHVPLLWVTPDHTCAQVKAFTEQVDLAPAFLHFAGVEKPYDMEGQNLFDCHRDWAFSESCDSRYNGKMRRYEKGICYATYVDLEWHYIHSTSPGHCALYHLAEDPHCHRNVVDEYPRKADELRTKLLNHILSASVAHQDNSLPGWQEYFDGAGIDVSTWD